MTIEEFTKKVLDHLEIDMICGSLCGADISNNGDYTYALAVGYINAYEMIVHELTEEEHDEFIQKFDSYIKEWEAYKRATSTRIDFRRSSNAK